MNRFLLHRSSTFYVLSRRPYSGGFLQNFINKLKQESVQDAELKESIRKFREETAKLEQSKELQSVREFYKKIEKELPGDTVEKVRDTFQQMSEKLKEEGQRITQNEAIKKGLGNLSKAGEQVKSLGQTELLKAAMKGVEAVDQELQSDRSKVYRPLKSLRTRAEIAGKFEDKIVTPDSESSGVVLHRDSKWFGVWQEFKDNNQYVQKFFDLKAQYEESDHMVARSVRFLTDRVSQLFGGSGSASELQVAMDEVMKMDPSFDVDSFLHYCRFVAIPNVLEAYLRWDFRILNDWCHESVYGILTSTIKEMTSAGCIPNSRILDVSHVDLQTGRMTEQGPILIISFQTQQIECVLNTKGECCSGDPHKVLRVSHIWAMCRNQDELHPWAAWRVLDVVSMPTEQWL